MSLKNLEMAVIESRSGRGAVRVCRIPTTYFAD